MIVIRDVHVSRLRSIRESKLINLADFSVLAGLNNSGKSNFVRALNLFFTGQPEPDLPFDLVREYYRGDLRAKKRKIISVSVHFSLPSTFKFRRELETVEDLVGRDFTIRKEWIFRQPEPLIFLNESSDALGLTDAQKVNQFLALISFRYIPNRVVPIEIIRQEQQALRNVLVRRLARYKKQSAEVFRGLEATAESLVQALSEDVRKFAPDVQKVRLATAAGLAELAFQFGYKLEEAGVEMDETEQGSGMQSVLMFETLHLIDRDYFQRFGWKQAAIWAVEEPESSLNTALEARTAHLLSRIATEHGSRLQILATTHSDLMIQYAGGGYYVEKLSSGGKSETRGTPQEIKELVESSSRRGVSRWVNPLLLFPLDPVVLVEGKFDRDFLNECFLALRVKEPPRITCLEDIGADGKKGGVDSLINFVKENADVIRARQPFAKVCVLLDWDSASKISSFATTFKASDPFVATAWDVREANPSAFLTENCKGIERFYPDSVVTAAKATRPDLFFTNDQGVTIVKKKDTAAFKKLLNDQVSKGLTEVDAQFAKALISRITALLK